MKKILIPTLACLLTFGFAFAGEPSAADQKWLATVETMVTQGKTKISTPSKVRIDLLQELARKKGYSVEITKSDENYRAQLSKNLAKN